ncbi:UNVERIFIED_CONTAM: hypothetical protein Scaly_0693000 [Sesamum calycinum]|uniref:Uncharacterized protein n=1 Tax=Sesamum calycinum TaxID=2727403 RepID=A0AAW2R750_9LAMI
MVVCREWLSVVGHPGCFITSLQTTPLYFVRPQESGCLHFGDSSTFGRAAGQEINFEKSSVVFSKNTTAWVRVEIQDTMRIRVEDRHDLYLELPSVVGKSRRIVFQFIRDRIWKRISGWNERNLSQAGKEVSIKAVAQAIRRMP